ncbi:MAG: hypothetical protein J6Y99_06095 [Bacteroidales bacterium]|nr:hypothetical protein [Bacteroidales bacterium]
MFPLFLFPLWIDSHNPAGLEFLSDTRTSQAEVWASGARGGWVDFYQGDKTLEWGAQTQSLYRVNERWTLQGEMCYRNSTSQHVTGSVFIDPTDLPFDLLEYNRNREGETQLEHYHLLGGMSGRVNRLWQWGLRTDFTAANYAKRRDLRHQNRLMQMDLSSGVVWSPAASLAVGLSYDWNRRVEGVSFNIAGTSDEDYYTLISYGNFYGIKQLATSYDGYASTSNGMIPLVDERHRFSLQLGNAPRGKWQWFNELSYTSRSGYYGRESLYSIVYTDHEGKTLQEQSQVSWQSNAGNLHRWQLSAQWDELTNHENLFNEEQQGGGLSRIVYQGKMQRLEQKKVTADLTYTGQVEATILQQPRWTWQSAVHYRHQEQRTTFFPMERWQEIGQYRCQVSGSHAWAQGRGAWTCQLESALQWGDGTPCRDKNLSGGGTATTVAVSLDRYLHHQYEYLTARQWQAGMTMRYTFAFPSFMPYVEGAFGWQQTFHRPQYVAENRAYGATLRVGMDF